MTALARHSAHELDTLLSRVRASSRVVRVGGDLFVPLVLTDQDEHIDAELLDEGLAERHTVLREVGEHGDVNRILVSHYGRQLLLLIDGEQIIGAKQNRVFNASFLIAPDAHEVEVAVSCVERGRWAYRDRRFSGSNTTLTGLARSRKLRRVAKSIITGSGYDAEQRAVWDDVDDFLERSRVISRTSALEDALASRRDQTITNMEALAPIAHQVGIALIRADRVALLDLFGSTSLYARAYRKITSGMLSDPAPGTADPSGARAIVSATLERMRAIELARRPGPSCGETLHGEAGSLSVGAIVHEGSAYHVVAGVA